MKQFLEAGEFVSTHGIQGELKLYPWCDGPEFMCGFKELYLLPDGKRSVNVNQIRAHKNICIVKLDGVNSPEEARIYIGKTVYIKRADVKLEKGSFFVQDLIGCTVQNAKTGEVYGEITAVSRPGAHDVYTIKGKSGSEHLFPAVPEFVEKTDIDNMMIYINPIQGMFEQGAKSDDEN